MATATQARITADEFFRMDLGEGVHELVHGEIVAIPPPEFWHGRIRGLTFALLDGFGRRTGHGFAASNDAAVVISEDTVRDADVCYYSEARWPRSRVGLERPPVVPDLVVEVLSPGDRPGKIFEKLADYLAAGVPMVWLIDSKRRTLAIYRLDDSTPMVLGETGYVEGLAELPGFRCQVAAFFG